MKVLQFPLARITLCFIAGIAVAHVFDLGLNIIFALLAACSAVFAVAYLLMRKNAIHAHFGIGVFCMSFAIGASTLAIHNGYFDKSDYIRYAGSAEKIHKLQIVLREKLKSSAYNSRYIALVKQIDGKPASGRMLVNISKSVQSEHFFIGTNLLLTGKLYLPKAPANPGQFDYGSYLLNKSIMSQMYVGSEALQISRTFDKNAFYYADAIRTRILNNLEQSHFHQSELAVAAALILGQQQDISAGVMHDYQFAGAIHILSVSGLHVGFILLFLNFLLNYLPKNRMASYFRLAIVLFSLWGFAVLAGLSPSVIRSVTMFSFVALGMHLKRQTNIFHTLLVSIFLILLFEPSFLFDVGFQLSYLALFFILWLQPMFYEIWKPKYKIIDYFWQILTVSFAAQIGTLPLSLYYFHQFPGLFFVTNLVIIPFLGVVMSVGVLVMILAAVNCVPQFLALILEWSIFILNRIINWIASFEQFIFKNIPFNAYMLLGLYVFVIAAVLWFEKRDFKRSMMALSTLVLFQLTYFGSKWSNQSQREWLVFNIRKSTLIGERKGEELAVFSNEKFNKTTMLQPYLTEHFCHLKSSQPIPNIVYFNSKKILLIDKSVLYPKNLTPNVIMMRQSPKINLDRLLRNVRPSIIVADASNFKSYVKRWEATCAKEKIPFHATAEKGFYCLR